MPTFMYAGPVSCHMYLFYGHEFRPRLYVVMTLWMPVQHLLYIVYMIVCYGSPTLRECELTPNLPVDSEYVVA